MRYPASEKLEVIRLVEQSHLPVTRTLGMLGIPRTTYYRWYDRYQTGGSEALEDRPPRPTRVWNRIPDEARQRLVQLALDEPELSPRELAVRFADTEGYFIPEATIYRLLKAHDLITSPAFIVMKAAEEFLNEHVFASLRHARDLIAACCDDYNLHRPHSSLNELSPREFNNRSIRDQTLNRLNFLTRAIRWSRSLQCGANSLGPRNTKPANSVS